MALLEKQLDYPIDLQLENKISVIIVAEEKRVGRSHKDFPVPLPKDFLYRQRARTRQYGSNIVTRESGEPYLLMHSGAKEVGTVAVIKLHREERLVWLMVLRRFQFIMFQKA